MYLFELVADDLCGTVMSLRRRRQWRALPCWDPRGGLAWAPRAACMSGSGGRSHGCGPPMRQGPSGLASSGVLPAGGMVAMWAGTIQARSSMAWSPGYLGGVGGPDDGVGSEQGDKRGCGRPGAAGGRSRASVRAALIRRPRLCLVWPGLLVFLVRAHRARAVAQAPTPVPGPGQV